MNKGKKNQRKNDGEKCHDEEEEEIEEDEGEEEEELDTDGSCTQC